jgi:hypothetical protein
MKLTNKLAVLQVELYIWLILFASKTFENRLTRPCLSEEDSQQTVGHRR